MRAGDSSDFFAATASAVVGAHAVRCSKCREGERKNLCRLVDFLAEWVLVYTVLISHGRKDAAVQHGDRSWLPRTESPNFEIQMQRI